MADAADDAAADAGQGVEPEPYGEVILDGTVVTTFDPTLVVADDTTTPDLDARERRQKATRKAKGPERKPTSASVVKAPPPDAPPPSDPS